MKKQVIFGLAALLSFSVVFASCGDDDEDTTTTTTTTTTTNNGKEGKYTVAYDAENAFGATGSTSDLWEEVDNGTEITIKGQGKLVCASKTFVGWNTKKDGSGTLYKEGDKLKVTSNITLYSIWQ